MKNTILILSALICSSLLSLESRATSLETEADIQRYANYKRLALDGTKLWDCVDFYKEKNDSKVLMKFVNWCKKHASEGSGRHQALLGHLHDFGHGVERSLVDALFFYSLSSHKKDPLGMLILSRFYVNDKEVRKYPLLEIRQDFYMAFCLCKEAADISKEAADKVLDLALFCLAQHYQYGLGCEKDINRAKEMYQQLAENGMAVAAYSLGDLLSDSSEFSDRLLSLQWFHKAATRQLNGVGGRATEDTAKRAIEAIKHNFFKYGYKTAPVIGSFKQSAEMFLEKLLGMKQVGADNSQNEASIIFEKYLCSVIKVYGMISDSNPQLGVMVDCINIYGDRRHPCAGYEGRYVHAYASELDDSFYCMGKKAGYIRSNSLDVGNSCGILHYKWCVFSLGYENVKFAEEYDKLREVKFTSLEQLKMMGAVKEGDHKTGVALLDDKRIEAERNEAASGVAGDDGQAMAQRYYDLIYEITGTCDSFLKGTQGIRNWEFVASYPYLEESHLAYRK